MNYDVSNSLGLKYKRFTPTGCKDKGIIELIVSGKDLIPLRKIAGSTLSPRSSSSFEFEPN